jgi:hypothetical protein
MTNAPTEGDFQPDDMLQPLPEHVTDALEHGWADPAKALNLEDANDLLEPGYLSLENGYARLADGKIHVACLTKMPGVNGRMINWWFGWMINTTHYKWWHPQAHVWSDFEQGIEGRNNNPDDANYVGDAHLVHEIIGSETNKLRIEFKDPSEYLDTSRFKVANVGTAICARPGYLDKPVKIGHMIHFIRDTVDGCEMRSRFWTGDIEIGIPVLGAFLGKIMNTRIVRMKLLPEILGKELLIHCAEEMNHLAGFLPDLFYKMTGEEPEGIR